MENNKINLASAPKIEGLGFRKFAGESDFPKMLAIIEAASLVDKDENAITLKDIKHDYAHLTRSDPEKDMIFAEIHGEPVAYSRVEWYQEENPNHRLYQHFIHIRPEWREKGIEEVMIGWCEAHLKAIAEEHPQDSQRFFQTFSSGSKSAFIQILESLGYQTVRYSYEMSRPLDDIPAAELPSGIEVRPAEEKDWHKVWEAANEAFRDHWGYAEPEEEDYLSYKSSKEFQPHLWQVAWDGEKIVGSVMNYIDHDYNQKFSRKRGWTENISTLKEYRQRGIASALIVRSMHMHKVQGMTEVGLGVDTNNPTGALRLYQSLGYQEDKTFITFRKEL